MRALPTAGAILALALAAGGCGGGDGEDSPSSTRDERSSQSSEDVTPLDGTSEETTETSETTEPEETDESAPEEEPSSSETVAAREGQIDGDAIRLEVTELRRSGATTALTFELSAAEARAGETEADAQIAQTFDDGLSDINGGKGQEASTTDGISLIDATNGKRYLVARDSEGACVCDGNLSSTFVESGAPVTLSVTFGAPPAEVDVVDVVIPKFGTFKDVPLS